MVTNAQIKTEFDLFGRVWKVYKQYYEPQDDGGYWDELVGEINSIQREFPGELGKDLALSILGDIERRYKEQRR